MNALARLQAEGIVQVDEFLSDGDCARIVGELRFAFWWPSTVVNRAEAGRLASFGSSTRVSETTSQEWFTSQLSTEMGAVEARLYELLDLRPEHLELWQATRYGCGGRFDAHDDAGVFADEPGGERTTTVLLYLDAPRAGGETAFPELDLVVSPATGRLVAWRNLLPDGSVDPRMRHAALPVTQGTKTTLVTWCRQRPVR